MQHYIATAPKAAEPFLINELKSFGATDIRPNRYGAEFRGSIEVGYRACLWSRVANRIAMHLTSFNAETPEQLYQGMKRFHWGEHMHSNATMAIYAHSSRSELTHTQFIAQKAKDGVVDQLRARTGERPSVDLVNPDIRLQIILKDNKAWVGIDLSGESLHLRGYRKFNPEAPLKENLAAIMLMRAHWPAIAADGGCLLDPMCGSGTLPIEAALMSFDTAPNLQRQQFGFSHWKYHHQSIWDAVKKEAVERNQEGMRKSLVIEGSDIDPFVIEAAKQHAAKAGLGGKINFVARDFKEARPSSEHGLIITNAPYGKRLSDPESLAPVYEALGATLKEHFAGYKACILVPNDDLGRCLHLRAHARNAFDNGPLECVLLQIDLPKNL
jgi:23S rRNA (guanine2445-N2)-methyltransferase / 23S rRNA (guanine2069-N7)-methyltransferase